MFLQKQHKNNKNNFRYLYNIKKMKVEVPQIKLYNNIQIPQFGLGVYQITDNNECEKVCLEAIKLGYRHIDTAQIYGNEKAVGSAIKKSKIPREEFFITTKIWITDFSQGKALKQVDEMLKRLDTNYIDLLLLHWPKNDYISAYKDMEIAYDQGKVKSIGLSNFQEKHIKEILKICKIKPCINQIELHPYGQRKEIVKLCQENNIKIEAWYPIAHGDTKLINNELFSKLAKKYKKTNVQIILRWHIQKGFIIFPRTKKENHLKENINIFDFELSNDEMKLIDSLDKNEIYVRW